MSKEPEILQRYYDPRERCFQEELGLPDFDGSEEIQDLQGKMLLATKDGQCIGGACISPGIYWFDWVSS